MPGHQTDHPPANIEARAASNHNDHAHHRDGPTPIACVSCLRYYPPLGLQSWTVTDQQGLDRRNPAGAGSKALRQHGPDYRVRKGQ